MNYAKLSELRVGEPIELDEGFTCTKSGRARVREDETGLHFICAEGKHYLDGQCDGDGYCIGVSKCA